MPGHGFGILVVPEGLCCLGCLYQLQGLQVHVPCCSLYRSQAAMADMMSLFAIPIHPCCRFLSRSLAMYFEERTGLPSVRQHCLCSGVEGVLGLCFVDHFLHTKSQYRLLRLYYHCFSLSRLYILSWCRVGVGYRVPGRVCGLWVGGYRG